MERMDLDENAKVASLLSAAGPAPMAPVQTAVAYDITPGTVEREMAQWFDAVGYPVGKTAVPSAAFGFIFERFPAAAERVAQRLRLSIDWHGAALRETDALFRFVATWPALESIGNPMSELYGLPTNGWQGLRQLAEDEGYQDALSQRCWISAGTWRRCEARLNALPQFKTEIDGLDKDSRQGSGAGHIAPRCSSTWQKRIGLAGSSANGARVPVTCPHVCFNHPGSRAARWLAVAPAMRTYSDVRRGAQAHI